MTKHVTVLCFALTALTRAAGNPVVPADSAPAGAPGAAINLAAHGPLTTPATAQTTLDRAVHVLGAQPGGGGLLVIPPSAPRQWTPRVPPQGLWREPPAPAPARNWGRDPGVTLVDSRGGTLKIMPPQVSGIEMHRVLNLPVGQSLTHWDYQPMLRLRSAAVRGPAAPLMHLETLSHNENQTFDVMLWRHNYSQGDNYMVDAWTWYMGDGHAAPANRGGALYSAHIESEVTLFRGRVTSWDPRTGELVYGAATNTATLASGRPLINLNPRTWITNGAAWVMHPGGATLGWSDGVRSRDGGWTEALIGHYFALDEPEEYVPGGQRIRRWWLITSVRTLPDGSQALGVQRHWWGAKNGKSVGRLYRAAHYTHDAAKPRLLRYVIAPGVNVVDASDGVESARVNPGGSPRRLRLAPAPFTGTRQDFAPGDIVEQAIGPDPFKPIAFRGWIWDAVPGVFPAPVFDLANNGQVTRHAALHVAGGSGNIAADRDTRADGNPPWDRLVSLEASANVGLHFLGDTRDAALHFIQPRAADGRRQEWQWQTAAGPRRLGVAHDGTLSLSGAAPLNLATQSLNRVGGLGGSHNLRGRRVTLSAGATRARVALPVRERDAAYAVIVRPAWPTAAVAVNPSTEGFDVEFDRAAPPGATFNWMLMR